MKTKLVSWVAGLSVAGFVASATGCQAPSAATPGATEPSSSEPATGALYNRTPTQFVDAKGTRIAYRVLGRDADGQPPLVLLQHITGTMDDWDPALIDGLQRSHKLYIFDNAGIGASAGPTPETVQAMAHVAEDFLDALHLAQVDLLGFSMGGFVAQQILVDRPALVRRAILSGTSPAGSAAARDLPQTIGGAYKKSAEEKVHPKALLFFTNTAQGKAAAGEFVGRIDKHTVDPDPAAPDAVVGSQMKAYVTWGNTPPNFAALATIRQPVLVTSGSSDVIAPASDSFALAQHIPTARLIVYPDSGHGALFQYREQYLADVGEFLR